MELDEKHQILLGLLKLATRINLIGKAHPQYEEASKLLIRYDQWAGDETKQAMDDSTILEHTGEMKRSGGM